MIRSALARGLRDPVGNASRRPLKFISTIQKRGMAGHGEFYVSKTHTAVGKAYLTVMFTWMGIRFYEDGATLLGLEYPWDHMHEHHEEHALVRYRATHFGMPQLLDGDDEDVDDEEEGDL